MASFDELVSKIDRIESHDYTESVSGKIGSKIREFKDKIAIEKDWLPRGKSTKIYSKTNLDDDKYKAITDAIHGMRKSNTFTEYKVYYNKLCNLTGIPKKDVVIVSYKFNKTKESNSIIINYAVSPKKVTIPNGSVLYHISQASNIQSLNPAFKGKSAKSYMYSAPRVYFTLRKQMPKFAADIKKKEKTTMYICDENIKYAFLDPLVPTYSMGAVYVETQTPIKVIKASEYNDEKEVKESVEPEYLIDPDEPTFDKLEDFMEYYGLEFVDDEDVFQEGIKEKLGALKRNFDGVKFVKDSWKKISDNIKTETAEKSLSESDKKKLSDNYDTISNTTNYSEYKKAYTWICNFFGIQKKDSIIRKITINDDHAECSYNSSPGKRIVIPNQTRLLHVSPVKGIKELIPSFRSKVKGKYLYPSKRVYFTLGKNIPGTKSGLEKTEVIRYTPKENIRTAFIDPACTSFNMGAIYVDTSLPIPVKEIDDDKNVKESVENVLIEIYESHRNGNITDEELRILLESIN